MSLSGSAFRTRRHIPKRGDLAEKDRQRLISMHHEEFSLSKSDNKIAHLSRGHNIPAFEERIEAVISDNPEGFSHLLDQIHSRLHGRAVGD